MVDSFTEVAHEGILSRLGNSIKGMLFGVILFFGSFILLFWNEGRAVQTARSLNEGEAATVHIESSAVDSASDGKLVHINGHATTDEVLTDEQFKLSENAIRLTRDVEMYQWTEKKETKKRKKVGGGTTRTTTYEYHKQWQSSVINSGSFHNKSGHENPGSMPINGKSILAKNVTLGAYRLPPSLVADISNRDSLKVTDENIPENFTDQMRLSSPSELYLGTDPTNPAIGDLRVRFHCTRPADVTVCAKLQGETFAPYQTHAGDALNILEMGTLSVEEVFQKARTRNSFMTWGLRALGAALMLGGFMCLTAPLTIIGDIIPFVGNIVQGGMLIVGMLLTLVFATGTIAFAWIFYRPIIGIPLLAVSIIGIFLLVARGRKGKHSGPEQPAMLGADDIVG